ncbi:hypothetical protein [Streptomyces benahoarensis]|uniref:Lipoprotein n=1 Tax=Streptomyces benahoarensis TaxID=2595054 RepID=A0A553YMM0_9ACTN|nr:hypothetical protein [Streptomyces benahoarensis]TSB16414.1 hypothetical protein FNJ62_28270 [Streptomyces benahoarensis]TSB30457.1 hypothetical protein FNZ23_26150 [Streptomyces benahoarensis]
MTLAVIAVLGGCSTARGAKEGGGTTPEQALAAARPDTVGALKAVMPGVEVDELGDSDINCGGSDLVDSKDASRVRSRITYEVVGDAFDRRSPGDLVGETVRRLERKGWKVEPSKRGADDVGKTLSRRGTEGEANVGATRFTLKSGKDVPILNVLVMTECLHNPHWEG